MAVFTGSGVAIVTPFHEDGTINYEAFEKLIEYQIASSTDAIIVCGTTGEAATMTEEERLSVIDFAVRKVAGRIPVIAGTGGNCTQSVVEFSKKVQELGVSALLVVTPYYNKCTQGGLYAHFSEVASSVLLPVILYNVPSRTGCNLLPETAVKIAENFPNVVGIKEASGNINQITKLCKLSKGKLDVYSGNDEQVVPVLSVGGVGVISVLANVAPHAVHEMVMSYLNSDVERAREIQLYYLDLILALQCEVNPIPVKAALNMLGFSVGGLRLPLTALEEKHIEPLKKELVQVGLLNLEKY